jgi:hypothetical protein
MERLDYRDEMGMRIRRAVEGQQDRKVELGDQIQNVRVLSDSGALVGCLL